MATPFPADNPLLRGAFEPLRSECDCADLIIDGALPPDLKGVLYRIGPNPQFAPRGPYNPLQGDGMVHAFEIRGGRIAYRNRWVRTQQWRLEREAGRALFSTGDPRGADPSVAGMRTDGVANTNIVAHAGKLLALEEGHAPIAIDPKTLETIGVFDFGGRLRGPMTAHPHLDPGSGELLSFANFHGRRFDGALHFHVIDRHGELTRTERVEGPYPALVHDFAFTDAHVVFVVCPTTVSVGRLDAGGPPIAWEPERGAFVGVMPRSGSEADTRWFEAPTSMVWHLMNAYGEGDQLHIDLCQQDAAAFPYADGRPTPSAMHQQRLARWSIDLASDKAASVRQLSQVVCEYPRIDERRSGQPYRCGFVAAGGGPGTDDLLQRALGRYDHQTGEMSLWRSATGEAVSEPVFAPKPGSTAEGRGYVLATLFDPGRGRSCLAIFDAEHIEDGPMARAWLDHRVPAGFHGCFVAG
jgi:carotenoid cleavage dioxygenase-like enzyme